MLLFEPELPEGMRYEEDHLTREEEGDLLEHISHVTFATLAMHGVQARRRVAFFGHTYEASLPGAPFPAFLLDLREGLARWAGIPADALAMALINEYPAGAPIGWHRDAPQYDSVIGLSLLSSCRMRLRPYVSPADRVRLGGQPRRATHELMLLPRSAYLLAGKSRRAYEHSIPPVEALRYSITFRTLRPRASASTH